MTLAKQLWIGAFLLLAHATVVPLFGWANVLQFWLLVAIYVALKPWIKRVVEVLREGLQIERDTKRSRLIKRAPTSFASFAMKLFIFAFVFTITNAWNLVNTFTPYAWTALFAQLTALYLIYRVTKWIYLGFISSTKLAHSPN